MPVMVLPKELPKEGCCGIVVDDGVDANIFQKVVILDNTFPHHACNMHPDQDRLVLMSECWHTALWRKERDALATLFAIRDRFAVKELVLAPWGYDDDDDLEMALKAGAVLDDLDYCKEVGYSILSKKNGKSKSSSSGRRGHQPQAATGFGSSDEIRPNTSIFVFNQQEHSFLNYRLRNI
jgi:hypothetical protein